MLRIFILCLWVVPLSVFASCPQVAWDETVILKHINDGDTVTLDNDRRVRFIGIDTPEINYRNLAKSEPYALQAKALLEKYLHPGDKLHLVYDKKKQDKYGRKLAYVYSKTGRNLALMQLKSGFARQLVVANNDLFWHCFQDTLKQAKLRKRGIWGEFEPLSAGRLTKSDRGYVDIRGRVTERVNTSKGLQLTLDRRLLVFISNTNLARFVEADIDLSLHSRLLFNGKLTFSKKQPKVTLYHPAQIFP